VTIAVTSSILFVCTANICRSVTGAHLLSQRISSCESTGEILIHSAGTHALPGSLGCDVSLPLAGADPEKHGSTQLDEDMIQRADLVVCAARDHRSVVARLHPKARARTFTMQQAGRIASFLLAEDVLGAAADKASGTPREYPERDHRNAVAALPPPGPARLTWLVAEMDAARGVTPKPESPSGTAGFLGDVDDVVDPHVVGFERHGMVVQQIRECLEPLATLIIDTANH
jgi:protein-tyrosine phosphatase